MTVNSLIPGGAADTSFVSPRSRAAMLARGRKLIDPTIMAAPLLWLVSHESLMKSPASATSPGYGMRRCRRPKRRKAREAPVLRAPERARG